jgi:hypothetical protein
MPPHNNENKTVTMEQTYRCNTTMKRKHYYGYASAIEKRFSSSEDVVEFWNAKI